MQTQDKIVEAARTLIMARGYNGFSYADVSDAVAIRKASIHHHFPTKADLVKAVVAQSEAFIVSETTALQSGDFNPTRQLEGYVAHWSDCIGSGSAPYCIAGILGTEMATLTPAVSDAVRSHFRALTRWLEVVLTRGASLGHFDLRASSRAEAESFISLVYGAMLMARVNGETALFDTIAASGLRRLLA